MKLARRETEMNAFRILICMVVALLLGACGGGSSEPDVPKAEPARAGSAVIGTTGGTVDAVLEGGAIVRLDVPAGAFPADTTVRIDPQSAPAGQLGSFTLSAGDISLRAPVRLTVTLPAAPAPDADTILLMNSGSRQVPVSAQVDPVTRTMTVDLPMLGPVVSAAAQTATARARPQASSFSADALTILLGRGNLARRINLLDLVTADLASDGSVANATNVQLAMASLLGIAAADADSRVRSDLFTWRRVVCGQQAFAISALGSFGGSDVATFSQIAFDVLSWDRFAQDLNELVTRVTSPAEVGCPGVPADFAQPVRDRLPAFLAAVTGALNLLDARADFTQLLTARIPELLKLESVLQGTDMTASVLPLIGEQTSRLRAAAYSACRNERDQSLQRTLLVKEIGDALFEAASPFDEGALQQDIQFCGMALHFKVLDAGGLALQQGDAGGLAVGSVKTAVTLRLAGAAKIVLSGPLAALICPTGSQNVEQLAFDAGPAAGPMTDVGRLTPSGANGYLESSPLELDVATLLAAGAERLMVGRIGGACGGSFPNLIAHDTIAAFSLDATTLQITTTSLPGATVGASYSATLAATGGTAPFTWSAAGVPAGLSLNPQTGEISGTPASAGTASLRVSVGSANGLTAQATISLAVAPPVVVVVPNVAGTYAGTHIDNTPNGAPPGPASTTVAQSGNLVLIGGRTLCEMAPTGELTFLGLSSGGFVVDPNLRVISSFTGQFLGPNLTNLTFRVVELPQFGNFPDDDSFFLIRQ